MGCAEARKLKPDARFQPPSVRFLLLQRSQEIESISFIRCKISVSSRIQLMKRIATFLLLFAAITPAWSMAATPENKSIGENGREARQAAKRYHKYSKKAGRKQLKAIKKSQKAQRKAAKRASRRRTR
jgi:hypothetical protein